MTTMTTTTPVETMMKTVFRHAAIPIFSAVLALAVPRATAQKESSAIARKNSDVYSEMAKVPRKAAARHNPLESDPEAVAAGAKLFELHCAECHGAMGEGGRKAPSLLAPEVQQSTPGTLFGSSPTE